MRRIKSIQSLNKLNQPFRISYQLRSIPFNTATNIRCSSRPTTRPAMSEVVDNGIMGSVRFMSTDNKSDDEKKDEGSNTNKSNIRNYGIMIALGIGGVIYYYNNKCNYPLNENELNYIDQFNWPQISSVVTPISERITITSFIKTINDLYMVCTKPEVKSKLTLENWLDIEAIVLERYLKEKTSTGKILFYCNEFIKLTNEAFKKSAENDEKKSKSDKNEDKHIDCKDRIYNRRYGRSYRYIFDNFYLLLLTENVPMIEAFLDGDRIDAKKLISHNLFWDEIYESSSTNNSVIFYVMHKYLRNKLGSSILTDEWKNNAINRIKAMYTRDMNNYITNKDGDYDYYLVYPQYPEPTIQFIKHL